MKKVRIILVIFLVFQQSDSFSKQFDKNQMDLINKIERFFKNLNTIQGNFVQFSEINEAMSEGKFYIKKPQKVRFEYKNPNNLLIVSNGDLINYYDRDLDEITIIPTSKTPIPLLFNNNFGLNSDRSNLIDIAENPDGTKKILLNINIEDLEYLVEYTFDSQITKILEISVTDENQQKTTLSLSHTVINGEINDSTFIFKNPRLYKNRK